MDRGTFPRWIQKWCLTQGTNLIYCLLHGVLKIHEFAGFVFSWFVLFLLHWLWTFCFFYRGEPRMHTSTKPHWFLCTLEFLGAIFKCKSGQVQVWKFEFPAKNALYYSSIGMCYGSFDSSNLWDSKVFSFSIRPSVAKNIWLEFIIF